MKLYPLFFSHGGPVVGRGFIAHVLVNGRCIREDTGDGFVSFFGVNPGGLAGQGSDQGEAQRDFLENIRLVVVDLAADATDFEDLKRRIEAFVHESNPAAEEDWRAAVQAAREGKIDRAEFARIIDAGTPPSVEVSLLAVEAAGTAATTAIRLDPGQNSKDEVGLADCA